MFIGHYAIGLAARRADPKLSLGTTFLACQWIDLVWPILLILGIEHARVAPGDTRFTPLDFYDYPWTHSLAMVLLWAAAFASAWFAMRRRVGTAILLAAVVVSHWVLDAIAHRPDLPLYPGSARMVGFGLWNFVAATIVVESLLFAGGLFLYARSTRAIDRAGSWGFWSMIAFFVVVYVANVMSPPPPSIAAVAWSALALWLLPWWAAWADRHRRPAGSVNPSPAS